MITIQDDEIKKAIFNAIVEAARYEIRVFLQNNKMGLIDKLSELHKDEINISCFMSIEELMSCINNPVAKKTGQRLDNAGWKVSELIKLYKDFGFSGLKHIKYIGQLRAGMIMDALVIHGLIKP